jgi:RNA polymerase primary sigma factor
VYLEGCGCNHMIELEQEDIFENSDLYEEMDPVGGNRDGESEQFPSLTRANYVDRVRFARIPDENQGVERSESPASSDPLYIYYRSMSKIPLLTREEEVYLAKKIESAKVNTLRLLALTAISSEKIMGMADQLQPAAPQNNAVVPNLNVQPGILPDIKKDPENELPLEERNRLREREIRKIVGRLERLEKKYRDLRASQPERKSRDRKSASKLQDCRESVFETLLRLDLSENQVNELICCVEDILHVTERDQGAVRNKARMDPKAVREARARIRSMEERYLTTAGELRRIITLIGENRTEMARAKDEFVRANLRLVLSIAKNYSYPGLDLLDLVQEGNIGLMKAVDKFNYRLGHKFSTYATWWIRQSITRAIADQGRTIRIPVHMVEAMNRVLKTANELTKRLGREPSVHELAKELKTPVSKVTQILKAAQEPISLEASIADNKDAVLNKFIEDKNAVSPDEDVMKHNLREVTDSALRTLSPREQEIVRMRYGLNEAGKEYTLQEVGEMFQVTRERIRQIEEKALLKLRSPYRSSKLREFADFVSKN